MGCLRWPGQRSDFPHHLTQALKGGAVMAELLDLELAQELCDLVFNDLGYGCSLMGEDGIRDRSPSRGLGDVYKRQSQYHRHIRFAGANAETV